MAAIGYGGGGPVTIAMTEAPISSPGGSNAPRRAGRRRWIRQLLPVFGSIIILAIFFRDYVEIDLDNLSIVPQEKWHQLSDAMRQANLKLAIAAVIIPYIAYWVVSVLLIKKTINWYHGPFPFWKMFWARGAINILAFVHFSLSGGGILLYTKLKAKISWRKLLGITLLRVGVGGGFGMLFLMIPATVAFQYLGLAEKAKINLYFWWAILLGPGLFLCMHTWIYFFHGRDIGGLASKVIVRNPKDPFWSAFFESTRSQWLTLWALFVPANVFIMLGFYIAARAFGVHIPMFEFFVVFPMAMFVMELPVAFAGFGTTSLAWLYFFGGYGSHEQIAAFTLFLPFCRTATRALCGLVSLKPAIKDFDTFSLSSSPKHRK